MSPAHVDLHDVAPQPYAPHDLVVDEHTPAPLHVPAVVSTPAVHEALLQEVVAPGYAQVVALVPSQRDAQAVVEPVPPHSGRPPTGVPMTLLHVPIEPVTLHAWHWPAQLELQQTPSTQKPLPHSVPELQAWPLILAHLPTEPARLHE